ncbi:hypothetical protein BDA99DRAFT_520774 [Phascolomyces articulosus]|uniref:Uncharacterized protein n=1 Tax=Phascolomyces articulosus TaxID=60185 RepID=A0AAD5K265_9FUNG|nr:hypothetical protein BDA99DRAFT_520774 [Phascolomyces articulosus]
MFYNTYKIYTIMDYEKNVLQLSVVFNKINDSIFNPNGICCDQFFNAIYGRTKRC